MLACLPFFFLGLGGPPGTWGGAATQGGDAMLNEITKKYVVPVSETRQEGVDRDIKEKQAPSSPLARAAIPYPVQTQCCCWLVPHS